MAQEIERKFLIISDDWKQQVTHSDYYRQGYLSGSDKCSIRIRINNDKAFLNIKSATLGIQRSEYEYEIPYVDGAEMLEKFCPGAVIEKTRYFVPLQDHVWEIDVFAGSNAGLVVAEIELDDIDEGFVRPEWLGTEVSDDPRYYNVCLVAHPFCDWK